MSRPTKEVYYMRLAHLAATRSTCDRLRPYPGVGAVIVKDDAVQSTGYSGAPRGVGQCDDRVCDSCSARFPIGKGRPRNDPRPDIPPFAEELIRHGEHCPMCKVGTIGPGHKMIRKYNEAGTFSEHCILTVHAETNAIVEAGRNRCIGGILYTTHLPCWDCAKLIVNSGVRAVIFDQPYQLRDSIELLHHNLENGILHLDIVTGKLEAVRSL